MKYPYPGWYVCSHDAYLFHIKTVDKVNNRYEIFIKYGRYVNDEIRDNSVLYRDYRWVEDSAIRKDLRPITEEEVLATRARWRLAP